MEPQPTVQVAQSALHQDGLFAAKQGGFQSGEVILHEAPMVALQSLENRQDVPVCANCFTFVGSARQHLMLLAGKADRQELGEADVEEKGIPGALFSPLVPCAMGCGELYCSRRCWEEHWARGHKLLCVGPISEEEAPNHPLVRFKIHAVSTNEIFLLVGDLISRVMCICEANGGNLQAALQPFHTFVHLPWWEVAVHPDPAADQRQFQEILKKLCVESSTLLGQALCRPGLEALFEPTFFGCVIGMFEQNNVGIRNKSPLYGIMDGLRAALDPALVPYVQRAYLPCVRSILQDRQEEEDEEEEGHGGHGHVHGENCGHGHDHHHHHAAQEEEEEEEDAAMPVESDEDEEEEDAPVSLEEAPALLDACRDEKDMGLFPPLDGTALYTLICKMNHSCEPNCRVQYVGGQQQQPLRAQLVALRPIGPGEELRQSYIDQNLSYADRQKALADYGFVCACDKCKREAFC